MLAVALAILLAARTGLHYSVIVVIFLSAVVTFVLLVGVTRLVTGEEQLVYYHQEIAVMLVTAAVVKTLHGPVLPYLDVTILGIGAFLACGRVGCLMVGCCHGRHFSWGIRYRHEHVQERFAPYLVGITLFPIQMLESLWVMFVVACGVAMMWRGQPPGTALAWYTISYGAARFSFEFIRGDTERPYTLGFSQGQWLSLWLMSALTVAEWTGRMPFRAWHTVTLAAVVLVMLVVAVHRKLDPGQRFRILHPNHVREVAAAIGHDPEPVTPSTRLRLGGKPLAVCVECTSLGFQISHGKVEDTAGSGNHYALSHRDRTITRPAAMRLANLILGLRGESFPARLVPGNYGVFHLVLPRGRGKGVAI